MSDFSKLKIGDIVYNVKDAISRSQILSHIGNTLNPHSVNKVQVGLGNVDNTSDIDKPVSTAVQTELDKKPNMQWNSTDKTYEFTVENDVVLQIGQEILTPPMYNNTGTSIANGKLVYWTSSIGASGQVRIAPFIANGTIELEKLVGITTESIANGGSGIITRMGVVREIDTTGSLYSETWADGTILYASSTNSGGMTSTAPTSNIVRVGIVIYSHAIHGMIYFAPRIYPTAAQIGLGNVPNVSTNNQTPTFTADTTLTTITSGETTTVLWGRVKKLFTDVISHLANTSNPHSTTAAQVGLGNVPNVTTNNQTPTYTGTGTLTTMTSGEVLSTAFSKMAKCIVDLITHKAANTVSVTHGIQSAKAVITISALNTLTTLSVTFPTAYTYIPNVVVSAGTSDPSIVLVSCNNVSTTGFDIVMKVLTGGSTGNKGVYWIATANNS